MIPLRKMAISRIAERVSGNTQMKNPWVDLPANEPFVLEGDHASILEFNERVDAIHRVHLEILPEPFIGTPEANVVFLNLNPGYNVRDIHFHTTDGYFIESLRSNLVHASREYAFYPLDPKNFDSPASRYWRRRLKPLIDRCGLMKVASGVLCVEYFPYDSKKYKKVSSLLISQHYSFHLVREAIRRNAVIVLMRAEKRWLRSVPQLKDHGFRKVRSWLNPTISERNLPDGFDEIVNRLGRSPGHAES